MRNRFDQQLHHLDEQLTHMGELCEIAISKVTQALKEGSAGQARIVVAEDEEIDQMEKEIERLCLKLLLQQQPVAKDLRRISAALKMITDMERIGDQAADIAELSPFIAKGWTQSTLHLGDMARAAVKMVTDSVEAFVKGNLDLARAVIRMDDEVDALFNQVKQEITELIYKREVEASLPLDLLMAAKYFERIGDHAVNIAEWVEYSITGIHKK